LLTLKRAKSLNKLSKASASLSGYSRFIKSLKEKVRSAQLKASVAVNQELIKLYWELSRDVVERQEKEGWGSKVIERIAKDLQNEFPGIEGFSRTNIFRMRAFYTAYKIVPQSVGQLENLPVFQIPWGHNIAIIENVKNMNERLWYVNMTIEEGWARDELIGSIKRNWFKRYGKAITNFESRLPSPHSHLAQQTLKDPLHFDFLEIRDEHHERELEDGLLDHISEDEKDERQLEQREGGLAPLKPPPRSRGFQATARWPPTSLLKKTHPCP